MEPYRRDVVAAAAGVTTQTLRNVIGGRRTPEIQTLRAIAEAVGVEFAWIIDDSRGWPPARAKRAGIDAVPEKTIAA